MRNKGDCVLTSEVVQHTVMGKRTAQVHRSLFPEDVPLNKRPVIRTYTRFEWAVLTKKQVEFDEWHANNRRGAQPSFHPSWVHSMRAHLPEGGWVAFTSRKSAQRFAQEILDGLWPNMVEDAKDHHEFCKSMDEMWESYGNSDDDEDRDTLDNAERVSRTRLPAEEDDSAPFYRDDDWEDRNLTRPNEFLTNFSIEQLPIYKEAVRRWVSPGDFEVKETDCDGIKGDGSLWYYGSREHLAPFWEIFDEVKASMKETSE